MAALLLSPIRAVLPEIRQSTAFYVLRTEQPLPPLPDRNCLCLSFADTENERHPNVFRREQAVQLRQFFDALPEDADLFVCCDSGQSRSAAIKAALLRYQGKDDRGIWDDPNYHPNACVPCPEIDREVSYVDPYFRLQRQAAVPFLQK